MSYGRWSDQPLKKKIWVGLIMLAVIASFALQLPTIALKFGLMSYVCYVQKGIIGTSCFYKSSN